MYYCGGPLGVSESSSVLFGRQGPLGPPAPTSFCPPFDAANICSRADGLITRGKGGRGCGGEATHHADHDTHHREHSEDFDMVA